MSDQSLTEQLLVAGYGHRKGAHYKHMIFSLSTGEEYGWMDAYEASSWLAERTTCETA